MQKKLFLQRNLRKAGNGNSPLLKYLVLAVVVLTLLVLITPHLIRSKGKGAATARRSIPDKGSLIKELPRPPEQELSETLPEGARSSEPAPVPATPPDQAGRTAMAPAQEAPPPAAPPAEKDQSQKAKTAEPPVLFPKAGTPAVSSGSQSAPAVQPARSEPKAADKPDLTAAFPPAPKTARTPSAAEQSPPVQPASTKAAAGKQMYAVQAGCFKEKRSAEETQRRLLKKGYDVILCPSAASSGGSYAYTVMTKPVDNVRKAATLLEQMKNEQKVSPTIIKMPPVCAMDGAKQQTGKQPVQKAQPAKAGQTTQ